MTKNNLFKTTALVAFIIAGSTFRFANAEVVYDTGDPSIVAAVNANAATTGVNIAASTTAIVNALQLLSGQMTENSQASMNGQGNIATTQDNRIVQQEVQKATFDAENQAADGTSACNVITGNVAGAGISPAMSVYQASAMAAQVGYETGGDKTHPQPSYGSHINLVQSVLSEHCATSATQADIDDGACPAGTIVKSPDDSPNDINTPTALVGNNGTNTLTPAQEQAASTFIALAFHPNPPGALPMNAASTAQGQVQAYNDMVNEAQNAIADNTYAMIQGRKAPSQDGVASSASTTDNESLSSWANSEMSQIAGAPAEPSGGYFPNGVSFDSWLMLRAEGWFLNPNWVADLNEYNETSAIKDLTMIESYRAYLQYLQYSDQENMQLEMAQQTTLLQEIAKHETGR